MPVNVVLGVEQCAPLLIAGCFQGLNLLLACKLFLERQRNRSRTTCLLNQAIELLDLPLEPELEVVGPSVELFDLCREELRVALGNGALDFLLSFNRLVRELAGAAFWRISVCPLGLEVSGGD